MQAVPKKVIIIFSHFPLSSLFFFFFCQRKKEKEKGEAVKLEELKIVEGRKKIACNHTDLKVRYIFSFSENGLFKSSAAFWVSTMPRCRGVWWTGLLR